MKIRVEILETQPLVPEGTYVYNSGEIAGRPMNEILDEVTAYVLRSLAAMHQLEVRE